jgi:deoxyribonuclease-4
MKIGCHLSTKGSLVKMIETAIELNTPTFQYFTRNPRGGSAREYEESEISDFIKIKEEHNIGPIVAHLPYTVNLSSDKARTRNFGKAILHEDLRRANKIGVEYLVMHPGSHVKNTLDDAINYIAEGLEYALVDYSGNTIICLETMSGKGTEVGRSIGEIKSIMEKLNWHDKLGVCLDSCHLFAAGYDFRVKSEVNRLIHDLEKNIGLERVFITHLNDSKMPHDSNKDRHENIGEGELGVKGIANYINNSFIKKLPMLLETPVDDEKDYANDIERLRNLVSD